MKGVFNMKVRNMRSPRTGIEVANQFIIEYGGQTIFQSYDVIIAIKEGRKIVLDKNYWDYSRTTSKYRNEFTGLTTEETKKAIKSGEIKLLDLNNMR